MYGCVIQWHGPASIFADARRLAVMAHGKKRDGNFLRQQLVGVSELDKGPLGIGFGGGYIGKPLQFFLRQNAKVREFDLALGGHFFQQAGADIARINLATLHGGGDIVLREADKQELGKILYLG